ncbi:MAG: protein kinase, partial [candidate division WOR-3 bacterium]
IRFQDFTEPSEIEELKIRLRQEVKAAGKLSHPNIVMIYDVEEEGGNFAIVMEYVDGDSLDKILKKQKTISLEESIRIIQKVCDALDYAHKQGIVHRDVKPANIIITKNGEPKLMDFGIAKLADSTVTKTGSALGTPSYTAPEMIKGEKVNARADIFSLGCVFYEMLTGERAFPGENITPIMYKILEEEPTPPVQLNKKLPPAVNSIIFKSLAKDLSNRYQSIEEFAQDLVTLIVHPEAISALKIKKRIRLEHFLLPLGVGVIGVLIVIFLILFILPLFRGEVYKVEWVENILYAKNEDGKDVWKRVFDAEISTALVSDINNDGRNEVVVGTKSRKSSMGSYGEVHGRIYLLDAKGKEIWNVNAGVKNAYRDFDDKYTVEKIFIEDIDEDNYREIIVTSWRNPWFPGRLIMIKGTKDLAIRDFYEYHNPGGIHVGFIDDIDKDKIKDFVCWAGNNDMGYRFVIFLLSGLGFDGQAPPWKGNIFSGGIQEPWYVPLLSKYTVTSLTKLDYGIIKITTNYGEIFMDLFGNILDNPNPLSPKECEIRTILRRKIFDNWRIAYDYLQNKDYQSAIDYLKKAIEIKSDNPALSAVLYMELGNICESLKKYNDAINAFTKANELDQDCYYPYWHLIKLNQRFGNYDEAIKLGIKAVALFKSSWQGGWFYRDLIESCILAGDNNKLEELCDRTKSLFNEKEWVSQTIAGDGYLWLGRFNDAIKVYKEQLSLDSLNAYNFVFEGLAKTYAYLDTNLDEAEKMIATVIKENPTSDSSLSGTLGWIHFKQAKQGKGNYETALNEVKKAIAYYSNKNHPIQLYRPTLAELYFFLANICEAMGKKEDAKEYYQTCLKLNRGDTYIKRVAEKSMKQISLLPAPPFGENYNFAHL